MLSAGVWTASQFSERVRSIPGLTLLADEPLSHHTRFAIGGPADLLVIASDVPSFIEALRIARESALPWVVVGGGTNLIVSDSGFRGIVLKLAARNIAHDHRGNVYAEAGAVLQDVVDQTVSAGLRGLQTMTGIPGSFGAAIYGNAGAYGHSLSEFVHSVTFFDGNTTRVFDAAECEFHYRESIFKRHKEWIVLSSRLQLEPADSATLRKIADDILAVRNQKYPPTMKCAGSIFKNYLFAQLPPDVQPLIPPTVVREGKVPSAWFLEQIGAKGLRMGDIQVADYHANLIYNDGGGTAGDLRALITLLKTRIAERFHMPLEEEVQYVGNFASD